MSPRPCVDTTHRSRSGCVSDNPTKATGHTFRAASACSCSAPLRPRFDRRLVLDRRYSKSNRCQIASLRTSIGTSAPRVSIVTIISGYGPSALDSETTETRQLQHFFEYFDSDDLTHNARTQAAGSMNTSSLGLPACVVSESLGSNFQSLSSAALASGQRPKCTSA